MPTNPCCCMNLPLKNTKKIMPTTCYTDKNLQCTCSKEKSKFTSKLVPTTILEIRVLSPCSIDSTDPYSKTSKKQIPNTSHPKNLLGKCAQSLLKTVSNVLLTLSYQLSLKSLLACLAHYAKVSFITKK
jgi:hypothetical protein